MQNRLPNGVWPTMPTPFRKDGQVDYPALEAMVEWYIQNEVSGLFAVCQSSEMFHLNLEERTGVARFVKEKAAGRVPVVASGHISDSPEEQLRELSAMAETGVDAVVMVTNRLAGAEEEESVLLENALSMADRLPKEVPLGLYECPQPFWRVLSPKALGECGQSGRFVFCKDTCRDGRLLHDKILAVQDTPLQVYNANTTTLLQSLRDGGAGFSGVMANFQPRLYAWLCTHYMDPGSLWVQDFLSVFALIELQMYPVNAKYALQLSRLPVELFSRAQDHTAFDLTLAQEVEALQRTTREIEKLSGIGQK